MTRKVELNILIGKSWFTTILSLWSAQMAAVFVQCIRIITEVVKEFIIQASTFYIVIIQYKTVKVDGVNIFFRQAENMKKATILLLHGFPSSSHMFRNLAKNLQTNIILLLLTIQDLETVTNLQSMSLNTHLTTWPM